jgi:hypothetical protein
MSGYNVIEGTLVRFYTSTPFTAIGGTVTDPTEVKFAYKVNTGATTTYTYGVGNQIVRDATGTYHIDIDTTGKPGLWTFAWVGYGNVQTRSENQVVISPMSVTVIA